MYGAVAPAPEKKSCEGSSSVLLQTLYDSYAEKLFKTGLQQTWKCKRGKTNARRKYSILCGFSVDQIKYERRKGNSLCKNEAMEPMGAVSQIRVFGKML